MLIAAFVPTEPNAIEALAEGVLDSLRTGDEVVAVHCVDYSNLALPSGPFDGPIAPGMFSQMLEYEREVGRDSVRRFQHLLHLREIHAKGIIIEGTPRKDLLEYALKAGVDLIAVTARDLGFLSRMFLGSTSQYILHHSQCPVLVVKEKKKQQQRAPAPAHAAAAGEARGTEMAGRPLPAGEGRSAGRGGGAYEKPKEE
eukprot:tig00000836_g4700.t2